MRNEQTGMHAVKQFIHKINVQPDTIFGLLLWLVGLYAYIITLAPTVIEGDAALFQYTPYVLGVTYPTGFPLYLLLGKVWVTIIPFGEIAWRMNLFSAVSAASALPLIYGAARRWYSPVTASPWPARWSALGAALIFATIPTFWRWATEAKTYGLNILLFSAILYLLARAMEQEHNKEQTHAIASPPRYLAAYPLLIPTFLLGLLIAVHNTGVLLLPGFAAIALLYFRSSLRGWKSIGWHGLALAIPGLFYLYIPLRAETLIAELGRQGAIEHGLLADFYHSGPANIVRYFAGVGFTEGVATNWGDVPAQFFSVYVPLLIDEFTLLGVGLGLAGGLAYAIKFPRRFLPLFLFYATPIPFVLAYGQGEQSAFLLPSFLIFAIFCGYTLATINAQLVKNKYRDRQKAQSPMGQAISSLIAHCSLFILICLVPALFIPQIQHNLTWLTLKWNRSIYDEWADALNHPLEPNAGMLAHWGDLTSFWYMQHSEGHRPDLRGVYPPTEENVINWYQQNNTDLYIAGPLQGWAEGIEQRYHLIPWGRLVRIAPRHLQPQELLPELAQPLAVQFATNIRLLGAEYSPQAVAGQDYPVTLTWQALETLPAESTVSLRLVQGDAVVAQLDDRLRSGWFPRETMPAGQYLLNYPLLPVPLGTLPGIYRLQLVVYQQASHPWPQTDGSITLDLGPVEIVPPPANTASRPGIYKTPSTHDFNAELELVGYNYTVSRVGQGKGFGIELLWHTLASPTENYSLQVDLLDRAGNVLRSYNHQPVAGRAPTTSWQPDQFIKDQIDVVVPASAPTGEQALQVRLRWLRPNNTALSLRRWGLPLGNSLQLETLHVTEKENRIFSIPTVQHPLDINLDNKVRLIGYNSPQSSATGSLELNRSACQTAACTINLELYWQGRAEMDHLYNIFLHVINSNGEIVTQQDRAPGAREKEPTTGWLPGEVVLHPITMPLPDDIVPGQYTLRVGMYLPPDGPRLPVVNENGQPTADFVDIGNLEILAE